MVVYPSPKGKQKQKKKKRRYPKTAQMGVYEALVLPSENIKRIVKTAIKIIFFDMRREFSLPNR